MKESDYTKVEIENLKAAETKDAKVQYYKIISENRLHFLSQPKACNFWLRFLSSIASQSNTRLGSSDNIGFNTEGQNQLSPAQYKLPSNLSQRAILSYSFINNTRTGTKDFEVLYIKYEKYWYTNQ